MFSRNVGSDMYRPLVLVSYTLNYRVEGFEVRGNHVVNLQLHVLVTWLVYGLLVSIGGSGYGSLFAAALFGVHPLAAEPVNYISSRSESMAALFALLPLVLILYEISQRGGRWAWWGSVWRRQWPFWLLSRLCGRLLRTDRRGDDGGEAQVMDGPGQHAGERTATRPRSRRIPGADESTPEREPPGASASGGIFPLSSGFRKPREIHQR